MLDAAENSSRAAVNVMINGRGPYRFLLETGAQTIRISDDIALAAGLKRTSTGGGATEYHADSMNIGPASFKDVQVTSLPPNLTTMAKETGIAGLLGLPFYKDVILTIDYPGHRVRIAKDSLPATDGADILPLTKVDDYYWGLPITIAGQSYTGVLDTQNAAVMGMPPRISDKLVFNGELKTFGTLRGVFGSVPTKLGQLKDDVHIGRHTFSGLYVTVTQLPPQFPSAINIGTGILDNFVLTLDQQHARIRLARSGTAPIVVPPPKPRNQR
jgi:hypothetical protein